MPKLKDSRGIFHRHYKGVYQAEACYRREARKARKAAKLIETPEQKAKRLHRKRPDSAAAPKPSQLDIVITEPQRKTQDKDKVAKPVYYCINCGEGVKKTDGVCPVCGIELDWSNL